ncbi:heme biosynthesis protein HemY [Acinetobacter baumannii]|nr:heme biosynthesis protein HemY [Acinetobacter baumannii]EHU1433555.1 heme biosynthesis protein HemY [Acinetobacter baumannii]
MKHLLWVYFLISLVLFAALALLSYGYGMGYVYIYWRQLQLQTNVWGLVFTFVVMSFIAQVIWLWIKRYSSREQRKRENIFQFKNLHPYEQLGIVWLLEAAEDQRVFIERVFTQSGLLKNNIDAKFLVLSGDYQKALEALDQSPPMAFELAELQRIEIFLAQNEAERALTHLEFLYQHQLSPWLEEIETAYQQRLTALWGQLALQQPWVYLRSMKYGLLDAEHRDLWLQQLLQQFDQASIDDLQALQQRYLDLESEIQTRPYSSKLLWLKLLARMPEMSIQHEVLTLHLLKEQFDPDVFYLWFQQQLLKQVPDYADVEEKINQFESQYMNLPVLTFAKWHVYMATGRQAEAEILLSLYPDNILMSYLRIKSTLKEDDELIKQLNLIFENDANFLKFKI